MADSFVELNDFPTLFEGYVLRAPLAEEAPALTDILRACEIELTGKSEVTLNDFLAIGKERISSATPA